jgi:probable HAF family extracellular repeat protein
MRLTLPSRIGATGFLLAMLLPAPLIAQDHEQKGIPQRYKLIDLGTFGGPHSRGSANGDGARLLNDVGVVASYADFATADPNAPDFCFDPDVCLLAHAAKWRQSRPIDLGALDNSYSSLAGSINDRGWATGQSQTGVVGPDFPFGFETHAVLWKGQHIEDLGTLPGGNASIGISVNNAGQVVGFANNGIPDPFAQFFFPSTTQMRVFFWHNGNMEDIGTLGGPDAGPGPGCDNQRPGVIVGNSYINFTPNADSGQPTINPFLWDNGTMTDLGNLGGTFSIGQCANNHGEVIGDSNLPGDLISHAFRWRNGKMKDLGTLGGPNSDAVWINDAGDIAGSADLLTTNIHDAVIWRHGRIKDLGTLPGDPCSRGAAINSRGQLVGGTSDCRNFLHAFVWQEGGPMRDLNKLIRPGSGLQLTNAFNINDRGEILAKSFPIGTTPTDDEDLGHLVLLIPCEAKEHDGGCSDDDPSDSAGLQTSAVSNSRVSQDAELQPGTKERTPALIWKNGMQGEAAPGGAQPSAACIPNGDQCRPGFECCPGLVCVPASTRAFCRVATTCTAPSSPGVKICKPANGSAVSSPVLVQAKGTVTGTIARMELWVDGAKKYTAFHSGTLITSVSLAAGSHRFGVFAVNTAGTKWKTVAYATVH